MTEDKIEYTTERIHAVKDVLNSAGGLIPWMAKYEVIKLYKIETINGVTTKTEVTK